MLSLLRARTTGLVSALCLLLPTVTSAQSISLTGGQGPVESFDSLLNTPAGSTSSTLPSGWYLFESGTAANTSYAVDDGSTQTGNTYSYGAAAGDSDRALGTLLSGSLTPTIGAQITNNTGGTLTDLTVAYTGEQWRLGAAGRVDRLDFQYSTNATALNNGTWVDVNTLDFTAPIQTGAIGKLDGNAAANRLAISGTISGLSVPNGNTIWVRWSDFNPSGADDGLAIDDVRFGTPGDFPPTVGSTIPADTATNVAPTSNLTVNFSEPVTLLAGWYNIACDTSGTHTAAQSGGPSSYVLDPDTDFVNSEVCTVSIDATKVIDQDGVQDPMAADYRFSFTIASDQPPAVASTTPTNNATNVAANTNLTIKFTESVTATDPWFAIACTLSGTHTATHDAGPSTFVVDPDTDFAPGDSCTVTIDHTHIVDQDGTPDAMAANYTFGFAVAAGDTAPTVVRTEPADGNAKTPWAADISIFFSEPVTAPDGAFTITCASSGAHAFVASHSTAGSRYLLNPTTDFAVSEACTVTVNGAQVFDQDGTPNPMAANYLLHFTTQADATNYWAGVDTSSCSALRTTVHNKIKDHVSYMYSPASGLTSATATWNILEDADEDPLNPAHVLDIYRNRSYVKVTDRSGAQDGTHYNREHTWPNSHGFNDASGLDVNGDPFSPYTDTHMLYASAADFNADRGNNPYGNCPPIAGCVQEATDANGGFGGGGSGYPGESNWSGGSLYEVWSHRKGDAARAVLYMDVRYEGGVSASGQAEPDLIVTDNTALITNTPSGQIAAVGYMGVKSALVDWANNDPPDAAERLRNDVIYSYQGNRNPFIDHPEWVNCAINCDCTAVLPDPVFKDGFE